MRAKNATAPRAKARPPTKDLAALRDMGLPIYGMPGHLIRRLHQVSVSIFVEETQAAGIDLTPVQYAALTAVREYPRIDQATLGGVIAYDRTTIGGVIDRLEEKGLLRRSICKENRRIRQLTIESEGEKLLVRIKPLVAKIQARMIAPLLANERDDFMRCMIHLADAHNEQTRAPLRPLSSKHLRQLNL